MVVGVGTVDWALLVPPVLDVFAGVELVVYVGGT